MVGFINIPIAIVTRKPAMIVAAVIMIIFFIGLIIWLIRNINVQKTFKVYQKELSVYLHSYEYSEVYGERYRLNLITNPEQKRQLTFKVFDPQPSAVVFDKIESLIPERYDFYQSVNTNKYLCIYDSYFSKYYLLKQNLP